MRVVTCVVQQMIPGAHWSQLEFPAETNARMRAWLHRFYPPVAERARASAVPVSEEGGYERVADEL